MRAMRHWIVLSLVVLSSWGATTSRAEDTLTTITVTGEAVILEGDRPLAKQRALQEAFSAALTQVLGAFITAESYTRNFESIERGVYGKTQGYVKSYQVLNEQESKEVLTLTVKVTVTPQALKDDLTALGIVLDAMGNPVLAVTAQEQGLRVPSSLPAFTGLLAEKGFRVVEQEDDPDAQIVVQLDGKIQSGSRLSGLIGAISALTVKAYWKDSNRLIYSGSQVSNGAGLTQEAALQVAYQRAAEALFPQFLEKVLAHWQGELNNGRPLEIVIQDTDYRKAKAFQQRLTRIFGVKRATLTHFSAGKASLSIQFSGTSSLLAQLIDRTSFKSLRAEIVDLNPESISVMLSESEPAS